MQVENIEAKRFSKLKAVLDKALVSSTNSIRTKDFHNAFNISKKEKRENILFEQINSGLKHDLDNYIRVSTVSTSNLISTDFNFLFCHIFI